MTRLTRAESQARTRVLIAAAATRLSLRDGFQVTSLEQIGEEDSLEETLELLRVLAGSIVAGAR
jgi:hypothetical protein